MERSYRAIFSSSALMGSQQLVLLGVGILQAKVIAVLLGTSGVGLFGIYGTMLVLAQCIFSFGVAGSGVREIAVCAGKSDSQPVAEVVRVLQGTTLLFSIIGAALMILFRAPLGLWSFGAEGYGNSIVFVALALVATQMNTAQIAVFQGLRRLKMLAGAKVLGAVLSAGAAITLVYVYRERAIAPAFAATAFSTFLVSGLMVRRLRLPRVRLTWERGRSIARRLLVLGVGFLAPPLFASASAYAVRAILARSAGMQEVGLFQAAWMLTTFYSGVVIQAMGMDFFPRLSAAANDRTVVRRLANEQTEAGLIIVVPGLLACMVFAPLLLRLFYTAEFLPAVAVARWMLLGQLIRSAAWPMAYVPLALGRPWVTVATEAVFNGIIILATFFGVSRYGLEGAGVAFFLSSLVYTVTLFAVGSRLLGLAWTAATMRLQGFLFAGVAAVFILLRFPSGSLPFFGAVAVLAVVCLLCGIRALRVLDAGTWLKGFFRCANRP